MQTLAARQFLARRGVPAEDVISVNRDQLSEYDGEPVMLVMNACFYNWCFPIPPQVIPVFTGFQAGASVISRNATMLNGHGPIGCRDDATRDRLLHLGIEAYTTGCLTLTLPARTTLPVAGKPYLIHGAGAGAFPLDALQSFPRDLLAQAVMVFQRATCTRFPLSTDDMAGAETRAAALLKEYRDNASLVITSLHHAATPCHASGIPVIICRKTDDDRFSFLRNHLPYHVAPNFSGISADVQASGDILRNVVEAAATRAFDAALQRHGVSVS